MTAQTISARAFVGSERPGAKSPLTEDRGNPATYADPRNMAKAAEKLAELGMRTSGRDRHGYTFLGGPDDFEEAFGAKPSWIEPKFNNEGVETTPGRWLLPNGDKIDLSGKLDGLFWGVELLIPAEYGLLPTDKAGLEAKYLPAKQPQRVLPYQLRDLLCPSGRAPAGLGRGRGTHIVIADSGLDKAHQYWDVVGLRKEIDAITFIPDKAVVDAWKRQNGLITKAVDSLQIAEAWLEQAIASYTKCNLAQMSKKKRLVEEMVKHLALNEEQLVFSVLGWFKLAQDPATEFKKDRKSLEVISKYGATTLVRSGPLKVAKSIVGSLWLMRNAAEKMQASSEKGYFAESSLAYHGTPVVSQALSIAPEARYTLFQILLPSAFFEGTDQNKLMQGVIPDKPFDNLTVKKLRPDILSYSVGQTVSVGSQKSGTGGAVRESLEDNRAAVEAQARNYAREIVSTVKWPCLVVQSGGNASALVKKVPPPGLYLDSAKNQSLSYQTMVREPGYLNVGAAVIEPPRAVGNARSLRPSSEAQGGVFKFQTGDNKEVVAPAICGYGTALRLDSFKSDDMALVVPKREYNENQKRWESAMGTTMGTSFTAPQIAGVAAVYLSMIKRKFKGDLLSMADLAEVIRQYSQPLTPDSKTTGLDGFQKFGDATSVFDPSVPPKDRPGMASLEVTENDVTLPMIRKVLQHYSDLGQI